MAALVRRSFALFPSFYVWVNRLNRAVIRESFKNITQDSLLIFWQSFHFISLAPECYRHFGDKEDGGYVLALPISEDSEVISIGLGDNISFDRAISPFVARIHMFDHTISTPENIPYNAIYYDRGLGVISTNKFLDFQSILNLTNPNSPKILKIDIEGAEWEVFQSLTANSLRDVTQLIIEIHNLFEIVRNPACLEKAVQVLEIIKKDYWAVNINPNNWANVQIIHGVAFADVLEVTFLRKNEKAVVISQSQSNRGFPNNPDAPKLMLGNFEQVFR